MEYWWRDGIILPFVAAKMICIHVSAEAVFSICDSLQTCHSILSKVRLSIVKHDPPLSHREDIPNPSPTDTL